MDHQEDVFNTPTVVDCDVLEAAKENVQPLATGRRVTALSTILATPHAQREVKLAETRKRLRINVELALEDEDGDPLEAYCRLVHWTVENYPQGPSVESGLIELLEEATRVLKDDGNGKWRGDIKYLKLWLLYASFVERPTLIYRFLIANEIGTEIALLYEEYAAVLERDGRRKEADDAYALGIARRAEPLEHLKSRHDDFQRRMMSGMLATVATPPSAPATSSSRPVLGSATRSGSSSTGVTSSNRTPTTSSIPRSTSNTPLQIFMDPTGSESPAPEPSANAWTDIGTRRTRIKENVPEVKKPGGTTLKQAGKSKRVASSSSGSKIAIYRDPVSEEMPPPPVPASRAREPIPRTPAKITPYVDTEASHAAGTPMFVPFRDEIAATPTPPSLTVPESVMKVKKAGPRMVGLTSEAEALRRDPLRNYSEIFAEQDG